MTLLEARIEFARCFGRLLTEFASLNLIVAETLRDPKVAQWNATHCRVVVGGHRCERPADDHPRGLGHDFRPIGIAKSVHTLGLGVDLYIIKDGQIDNARVSYIPLGLSWKAYNPLARWGGDFQGFPDLGHFSFTWEGRS